MNAKISPVRGVLVCFQKQRGLGKISLALAIGALSLMAQGCSTSSEQGTSTDITTAPSPVVPSEAAEKPAGAGVASVTVHGSVAAIDKKNQTVTLKGPEGRTVKIQVRDPEKLKAVKVGDPVVATYAEAVAVEVHRAGSATPGITVQERRVSSKPGEVPAGAIGQEITVTGTLVAIDRNQQTFTIEGPEGNQETFKAQDPRNLEKVSVGELVEITVLQALAISLDKSTK